MLNMIIKLSFHLAYSIVLVTLIHQVTPSIEGSEYDRRQLIYLSPSGNRLVAGTFIHPKKNAVMDSLPESIVKCTIAFDSNRTTELLSRHRNYSVEIVSDAKLDHLIDRCTRRIRKSIFGAGVEDSHTIASPRDLLLAPGTKWCGAGNRSESYDDLGTNIETDMCCREHDHCPDSIWAGQTKYNLTNKSFITSSNCHCDEKLKECLVKASEKELTAAIIGNVYFNVLKIKCFKEVVPEAKCIKFEGPPFFKRCVKYAEPETDELVYKFIEPERFQTNIDLDSLGLG